MRRFVIAVALALPLAAPPCATWAADPPQLSGAALAAALKAGGHVIYLRHGHADQGIDKDAVRLGPCSAQRSLSTLGRADAVHIGQAFKKLAIPVGHVHASPYCRAIETAFLAFGPVEVDHDLRLWHGELTDEQRDMLPKIVRDKLARPPRAGTNTVYVAHNYKDVLGIELQQGEAAVLRVDGGKLTVIARVVPGAWDAHLTKMPSMVVASYALPSGARPRNLAVDRDGMVWFASAGGAGIGRLDPFLGQARLILLPVSAGSPGIDSDTLAALAAAARRPAAAAPWRIKDGALVHRTPRGVEQRIVLPAGTIIATAAATDGGIWVAQSGRDRLILVRPR